LPEEDIIPIIVISVINTVIMVILLKWIVPSLLKGVITTIKEVK